MNHRQSYTARRSGSRPNRNFHQPYHKSPGYSRQSRYNRQPGSSYINPSRFINQAKTAAAGQEFVPKHSFADFKLNPTLQANIKSAGYQIPTPIQDQAIPVILKGQDVVGMADTGSGKTDAFVIPAIQRLSQSRNATQVLVVAPIRELAQQIEQQFYKLAKNLNLYTAVCVGGNPIGRQIAILRRHPQIVIGTPGRLKDLITRGALDLTTTNLLVLDEIDRMLDMGFIGDIKMLVAQLPAERQSLGFSATTTPAVNALINQVLNQPQTISVLTSASSEHIQQDTVEAVSDEAKLEVLKQLLAQPEVTKALVFGQTKHGVSRLSDKLNQQGHRSESIHGNKNQSQRQRALRAFKQDEVNILVATDVAARGLDIPHVSHVVNYDLPQTYADYTHRIGRTGRAGRPGNAVTFVKPQVSYR